MTPEELTLKSKQLRRRILDICYKTGKGHIGGTFSILDILVALYYNNVISYSDHGHDDMDRDVLLIGKGHACLAAYAIWEDLGLIATDVLNTFGQNGSMLGTQFDVRLRHSEFNTGSLGHVVGVAAGMAFAAKKKGLHYRKFFAIIGDGECEEGSIWESVDFAVTHKLHNLIIIVDNNRLAVTKINDHDTLAEKFQGFGAQTFVINGHDFSELQLNLITPGNAPHVIIANTVKGKGVSFMENNLKWHQSSMTVEEYKQARKELECK